MKIGLILLVLTCSMATIGQNVELFISSIPTQEKDFEIEILRFKEDQFSTVLTLPVELTDTVHKMKIELPQDTNVRFYQLRVAGSPNATEFLYSSKENIKLASPLYDLLNGQVAIENSVENLAYARLLKVLTEYDEITKVLDQESSSYSVYDHDFNAKVNEHAALVEEVHHKLNLNLEKIQIAFPETYTAQVLIPLSKIPVRHYTEEWSSYYDGYLSFLHDFFFYFVNVEDVRILNHYAFQDKVFQYLNSYVDMEELAIEKAISALMNVFSKNPIIQSFVYSQLMKTYVQLDNEHFVNYLMENFGGGCGLNLSFEELKKMNQIRATSIGSEAPDILLYDVQNKAQSLKNTVEENEYTVVLFWVGWCEHCQKHMPELVSLASEFKKSTGFFAVSLEADKTKWTESTSVYNFPKNWVNVCEKVPIEKSTYAPLYHVSTTPSLFLLDNEGKIIAKNFKVEELKALLQK